MLQHVVIISYLIVSLSLSLFTQKVIAQSNKDREELEERVGILKFIVAAMYRKMTELAELRGRLKLKESEGELPEHLRTYDEAEGYTGIWNVVDGNWRTEWPKERCESVLLENSYMNRRECHQGDGCNVSEILEIQRMTRRP